MSIADFIFYLFLLALLAFMFFKPLALWYSGDPEPSEFHIDMIRIVSAVLFFVLMIGFIRELLT
ncbi:hypothetical protein NDK47_08945 [Brevibacillus ruminantium]|uniref:DUF6199 domain-containing protein n=1 Tax=Brevibacillus ruminantium TaxID=2950604 RepID=A0ABY4WKU0_9BACL|nr:hypothetical protein [Brevibacillus ruminantium]USG67381.1 hypothetical protein NDK47_08945 [Brevibacillus ruminantium]